MRTPSQSGSRALATPESATCSRATIFLVPRTSARPQTTSAISYAVPQSLTAGDKAQARANMGVLKKNYLLNGAIMVSQENGSAASSANLYYPVDQFHSTLSNAATVAFTQVASRHPAARQIEFE